MQPFDFHSELFDLRGAALDVLAANGFVWLSDFGSVDLCHDLFGLEVTAIAHETKAAQICSLLQRLFPNWPYQRCYYEDHNLREVGWKVIISLESDGIQFGGRETRDASTAPKEVLDIANCHLGVIEQLIRTVCTKLAAPDLTRVKRAELERILDELKEMLRMAQIRKSELENGN